MHQWKRLKKQKSKKKQSVVIVQVAALFFPTFFENGKTVSLRSPPCSDLISIETQIGGKINGL